MEKQAANSTRNSGSNKRRPNKNSRGGRGRGGNLKSEARQRQNGKVAHPSNTSSGNGIGNHKILVLHGSRQTGQLLLGRMDKLRKALVKECNGMQLIAPDALYDHSDDPNLRQWWDRHDNAYTGLETSMQVLQDIWRNEGTSNGNDGEKKGAGSFCGIIGFSQGARLAHLMALIHQQQTAMVSQYRRSDADCNNNEITSVPPFQGLQFVILVAGYGAPLPDNWSATLQACGLNGTAATAGAIGGLSTTRIHIPSLHIWGASDSLVLRAQSQAVMNQYESPGCHEHEGGHHVPMKAASIRAYIDFVKERQRITSDSYCPTTKQELPNGQSIENCIPSSSVGPKRPSNLPISKKEEVCLAPDEETAQAQQDEVEVLAAIYPNEVTIHSRHMRNEETGENSFQYPISYTIALLPEDTDSPGGHWPKYSLSLRITYPHNYPSDDALPKIKLVHENNVMEFSSAKVAACLRAINETAKAERGMPCVLSCLYAAKEFLDAGEEFVAALGEQDSIADDTGGHIMSVDDDTFGLDPMPAKESTGMKQVSVERIRECNLEGLVIAEELLGRSLKSTTSTSAAPGDTPSNAPALVAKGGSWMYTIGLVGKPSAGKSTFFNTASGFARQRGDTDSALGGATMAPHPFTTIDPNIGFCLVPAPKGSCPEEGVDQATLDNLNIGSSHGRDNLGHRLLPVLLKDVAGLVPGAYQGRGRGNTFLNDLTDATVLVHVVDASGCSDTEGNTVGEDTTQTSGKPQPLEDLAWIRNELIEWVFNNLMHKWDSVSRRGRTKLAGMFSGYGQTSAVTSDVLYAVGKYMEKTQEREHALDHLQEWDAGDVHRVVSAFLGVRFPMALALNKCDVPSATKHVRAILAALPLHGAHVGVPLSAKSEMQFVRYSMLQESAGDAKRSDADGCLERQAPNGTWECLQAAMSLKEPVLVFPVSDMTTYQPLPGMAKPALESPSLPNAGMIACLQGAGGSIPRLWDPEQKIYTLEHRAGNGSTVSNKQPCALRDVIVMKPGSTVEDVFLSLKRLGALGGDFVRAEGAGKIGEPSKQLKKDALVVQGCRILKIMTTKRTQWQQQHAAKAGAL